MVTYIQHYFKYCYLFIYLFLKMAQTGVWWVVTVTVLLCHYTYLLRFKTTHTGVLVPVTTSNRRYQQQVVVRCWYTDTGPEVPILLWLPQSTVVHSSTEYSAGSLGTGYPTKIINFFNCCRALTSARAVVLLARCEQQETRYNRTSILCFLKGKHSEINFKMFQSKKIFTILFTKSI